MSLIWVYQGSDLRKTPMWKFPTEYKNIDITISTISFSNNVYADPIIRFIMNHSKKIEYSDLKTTVFTLTISLDKNDQVYNIYSFTENMLHELSAIVCDFSRLLDVSLKNTSTLNKEESNKDFKKSFLSVLKKYDLCAYNYTCCHEAIPIIDSKMISDEGIYEMYSGFCVLNKIVEKSFFSRFDATIYFRIKKNYFI